MTTVITPVDYLQHFVNSGAFSSKARQFLDTFRHTTNKNSHYKKLEREEGTGAAEQWLLNRFENRIAFAASIEPIVRGIIALGRVRDGLIQDISTCHSAGHSVGRPQYGPSHKYIIFNEYTSDHGFVEPAASTLFGLGGKLGLSAVIIETGHTSAGLRSALRLAVSAWGNEQSPPKRGDLTIVSIDDDGADHGDKYSPHIQAGDQKVPFPYKDAYLHHFLGINPLGDHVGAYTISTDAERALGFPGAEDFLAASLPKLAKYFTNLAEKSGEAHSH